MKAIFITARTGSKRFPQKCLKDVAGKPAIVRVIERAKLSYKADTIVLCTTWEPEDDILRGIAWDCGIHFFRGSTEDKLMRWKGATDLWSFDFFVTFDGDDLLCDPELADLAFDQYNRTGADFIEARNVPTGAFTSGIKTAALDKVCEIKGTTDTEMSVSYFTKTVLVPTNRLTLLPEPMFQVEQLEGVPEVLHRPEIRMTMDYPDDLKFFDNIYKHFTASIYYQVDGQKDIDVCGYLGADFTLADVIEYLDAKPEVIKINQYLQERYLENQKNLTKVILK